MVSAPLHAQGQVNVICSVPIPWCEALAAQFTKETGIKVGLTQKGSGESMAQVAAEKANPKYDVWYAGKGDPHLQAAELGLTEEYKSPILAELYDWAARQAEQSKFRTDRCVIKGARNLDNAKKFYDWALTPAAQKIGGDLRNFQTPSNKTTPIPAGALKMSDLKLIAYDFAKYGSATERKRILEKWDKDVYALPR